MLRHKAKNRRNKKKQFYKIKNGLDNKKKQLEGSILGSQIFAAKNSALQKKPSKLLEKGSDKKGS
jgi:hypothetical protein